MKYIISIVFILALLISCGEKEEVKFEAFSPESFAYDLGNSWEVNSMVNVRGFKKTEREKELSASLSFTVDLVNPANDTSKNIFIDTIMLQDKEINYIQLEAQFELDSTYEEGIYRIIFYINDNYSDISTSAETEVKIEE